MFWLMASAKTALEQVAVTSWWIKPFFWCSLSYLHGHLLLGQKKVKSLFRIKITVLQF